MLRTRVRPSTRVVQRGFQKPYETGLDVDREPETLGDDAPCRGGAAGDPDACLSHGGSRIHQKLGGRCEWAALGEEL